VKAVVVERPEVTAFTTVTEPEIGPDEALVKVLGCGICGTDHHILEGGLPTVSYPIIPGHEGWGEVVEVGQNGGRLRVGDLVAIDPSLHCGQCSQCRRGHGNLCEAWGSIGGTRPGAWAELVAVPVKNAHVLPDGYPTEVAVLIEPVACLLRGLKVLSPKVDKSALVFGAGTMGVLWALALRLSGLQLLGVVETDAARRELCSRNFDLPLVAWAEAASVEADYVIDATGNASAMEEAFWRARPGGTVMLFGVAGTDVRVPFSPFRLYQRELRVVSSMAILHTYGAAVNFVAAHAEVLHPVVTGSFGLQSFDRALEQLRSGAALKIALDPKMEMGPEDQQRAEISGPK
jgi:2-desacetyl-2-hydroxyethyl bacteriochlorophyllide A dehydrogenase